MPPGHATCETLSGLVSHDVGLQGVTWPKIPPVVNRYLAHTASSRRTVLIQELASILVVAFAATTHDITLATCVTSHHTLHACAHPPICCTLYAAGRPTPPWQRINPLLVSHLPPLKCPTSSKHFKSSIQSYSSCFAMCGVGIGVPRRSPPLGRATRTARADARGTSPPTPGDTQGAKGGSWGTKMGLWEQIHSHTPTP